MRLQNNYFEDKFNTVYKLQENTSDDYINNYLDIQYQNTDASNKHTDNSKDSSNKNNALTNNASSYKKHKGNYKRKFEDNDASHKSNLHNNGHNTHYNNNLRQSYYNSKNNQTGNYFPLKRKKIYLNQQINNHINASNQITSRQQQNFQLVRNQNSKT